jgi:hypothetical protein
MSVQWLCKRLRDARCAIICFNCLFFFGLTGWISSSAPTTGVRHHNRRTTWTSRGLLERASAGHVPNAR